MRDQPEEGRERRRRQRFLEEVNAGYSALRFDPVASESFVAARAEWESTNLDGLEKPYES